MQSKCKKKLPTHWRSPFSTLEFDLSLMEEDWRKAYAPVVRREIRRAESEPLQVWFDADYRDLIELFQATIKVKGLQAMNENTFRNKKQVLFGHIAHPDYGLLAAHAYAPDRDSSRVLFLYNASAYRQYEKGTESRALCGRANRLLLHRALLYFKEKDFTFFDAGGYRQDSSDESRRSVDRFKGKMGGTPLIVYNYYPIWYAVFRQIRIRLTKILSS